MWTPPLRRLTRSSSFGYEVAQFADEALGQPLDDWQRWLVIHAGELLEDGRPRFRTVLVLVSRQNGKTELAVVLALFWQFIEAVPLILGTSTKLDYAKESWTKSVKLADKCEELDGLRGPGRWHRDANGEQESWTVEECRYKIAASNAEGGRSLTIDRAILDELRQHDSYAAWDAIIPAGNAVRDFQAWCLSNMGSDKSVVLNDLRQEALHFIKTGEGDPRLGLFEWSAPEGASPTDVHALGAANPNMGRGRPNGTGIDSADLVAAGAKAMRLGGKALTGFRTEIMCQRVSAMEPTPITVESWAERADPSSRIEGPIVIAMDVAPERESAAIAVAGRRADGLAHVEIVAMADGNPSWLVPKIADMLGAHDVATIQDGKVWRPAILGDRLALTPLAADFKAAEDGEVVPVLLGATDVAAACGALQDAVNAGTVRHIGQEQLRAALDGAAKRDLESGWAWGKRKSDVDITPLVAATLAFWGLTQASDGEPGVYVF